MTCVKCGAPLLGDDRFCGDCGHALQPTPRSCPACRFLTRDGARFCIKCGAAIADAAPATTRGGTVTPFKPGASSAFYRRAARGPTASARPANPSDANGVEIPQRGRAAKSKQLRKGTAWPLAVIICGCVLGLGVYLSLAVENPAGKGDNAGASEAVTAPRAVSGTLGTTRPSAEDFSIRRAFTQLYGSYDPNLDGAFWIASGAPKELAQWNGRPLFIRPLISRAFEEAGVKRQILVTNSLDVRDGDVIKQGTGCRACGSLIGAAVYEKLGNDWKLISRHDFLTAAGNWGAPPKVSLAFPRAGRIELKLEAVSSDQRDISKRNYVIALKERKGGVPAAGARASARYDKE